jgi:5-hydroxyisourate hydrolase-like protein (transthyretin family)
VIKYSIPQNSAVKMTIYDMTGRAVKTLVNQNMSPGNYEVSFDASNIASGIYFYKLEAGSFVSTKKMTLIK